MKAKVFLFVGALAVACVSCTTVKVARTDVNNSQSAVTSVSFYKPLELKDLSVVGEISVSSTVTQTVSQTGSKSDLVLTGTGFKVAKDAKGVLTPEAGSVFKVGELTPMEAQGVSTGLFEASSRKALPFSAAKTRQQPVAYDARTLALQSALYDLIVEAGKVKGDAIWMPSYVWEVSTEGEVQSLLNTPTKVLGTTTYKVTIRAKVVKFKIGAE